MAAVESAARMVPQPELARHQSNRQWGMAAGSGPLGLPQPGQQRRIRKGFGGPEISEAPVFVCAARASG